MPEPIRWGSGEFWFNIPSNVEIPPLFEEVSRREKLTRGVRYYWWNALLSVSYQLGFHVSNSFLMGGRPESLHDRLFSRCEKARGPWLRTRWKRGSIKVSGWYRW